MRCLLLVTYNYGCNDDLWRKNGDMKKIVRGDLFFCLDAIAGSDDNLRDFANALLYEGFVSALDMFEVVEVRSDGSALVVPRQLRHPPSMLDGVAPPSSPCPGRLGQLAGGRGGRQ